jgi:hypothetical protein
MHNRKKQAADENRPIRLAYLIPLWVLLVCVSQLIDRTKRILERSNKQRYVWTIITIAIWHEGAVDPVEEDSECGAEVADTLVWVRFPPTDDLPDHEIWETVSLSFNNK